MSGPLTGNDPDDATLAAYVLRVGETTDPETGRAYVVPGSFYAALVDAFMRADPLNRARLTAAFMTLGEMVAAYKDQHDGVARLRETIKTGAWNG